jgi:hypothetical protein
MYSLFIVCLIACLLIRGRLSVSCLCIVCLVSVWLAVCSTEASCLEAADLLSVYCLSGWQHARRRLLF